MRVSTVGSRQSPVVGDRYDHHCARLEYRLTRTPSACTVCQMTQKAPPRAHPTSLSPFSPDLCKSYGSPLARLEGGGRFGPLDPARPATSLQLITNSLNITFYCRRASGRRQQWNDDFKSCEENYDKGRQFNRRSYIHCCCCCCCCCFAISSYYHHHRRLCLYQSLRLLSVSLLHWLV